MSAERITVLAGTKILPGEIPPGDPRLKVLKTPADYLTVEQAYKLISRLTLGGVTNVASGYDPGPDDAHTWGTYGTPTMQLVRAACEFLSAKDKGTPAELNNRLDGPIAQRLDVTGGAFINLMAGIRTPAAAFREKEEAEKELFGPALDAVAVP